MTLELSVAVHLRPFGGLLPVQSVTPLWIWREEKHLARTAAGRFGSQSLQRRLVGKLVIFIHGDEGVVLAQLGMIISQIFFWHPSNLFFITAPNKR